MAGYAAAKRTVAGAKGGDPVGSKLACNKCGSEVPGMSWENHPGIDTIIHGNECIPLCPECGEAAEFSVDLAEGG